MLLLKTRRSSACLSRRNRLFEHSHKARQERMRREIGGKGMQNLASTMAMELKQQHSSIMCAMPREQCAFEYLGGFSALGFQTSGFKGLGA